MRRFVAFCWVIFAAAAIAAGCGEFGNKFDDEDSSKNGPNESAVISSKPFDEKAKKAAGCDDVKVEKKTGAGEHVEGDLEYDDNVPTSGKHNPVPLDWGIYGEDQPTEKWIHNLEHGHIAILYKGLSKSEYSELHKYVKRDFWHEVLLPRKANKKDGVYFVAWGASLYCEKPSAEALQSFVDSYRDQGPEAVMSDTQKKDEK